MDDTPVYFDMPPNRIWAASGGSAKVNSGLEKHSARLTAVLTVRADGTLIASSGSHYLFGNSLYTKRKTWRIRRPRRALRIRTAMYILSKKAWMARTCGGSTRWSSFASRLSPHLENFEVTSRRRDSVWSSRTLAQVFSLSLPTRLRIVNRSMSTARCWRRWTAQAAHACPLATGGEFRPRHCQGKTTTDKIENHCGLGGFVRVCRGQKLRKSDAKVSDR